jgi:hypothetical protein
MGPNSKHLFELLDRQMLLIIATQVWFERRHVDLVRRVQDLER